MHLELSEKEAKALHMFLGALNGYDILAALTRVEEYNEDMDCDADILRIFERIDRELKNRRG
jgi:hypothetical protein